MWDMLAREEAIEREEMEERRAWTWLDDRLWAAEGGVDVVREIAFLRAMAPGVQLPEFVPLGVSAGEGGEVKVELGPFWGELRTGRVLVELHNAVVARSKRPFGAIPVWHADTGKPYRCAENLRFWIKAAELRWEVHLTVDVRGVVAGVEEAAWRGFEGAVWEWVGRVRGELAGEIRGQCGYVIELVDTTDEEEGGWDEPAWSRALPPSLSGGEEEVVMVMRDGWDGGCTYTSNTQHTEGPEFYFDDTQDC